MHTMGVVLLLGWVLIMQSSHCTCHEDTCRPAMAGTPHKKVCDHRGSNSQVIDFENVKIYPIFTIKIKNPGKSNT